MIGGSVLFVGMGNGPAPAKPTPPAGGQWDLKRR